MRTLEKADPQSILSPVNPIINSEPANDETAVVTQKTVENLVSHLTITRFKEPIICMLFSIRNYISRHIASYAICKSIVYFVGCLFVIIPFLSFADVAKIPLTPEEVSWLKAKHMVRVRIGNSPPFMITEGKVRGIAIDYLTQIFNYHGIKFSYISESEVTWPQALKYIAKHDIVDMVPTAKITEERKKNMLFTNEYISAPWVIFTRSEADFTSSIEDLKGKSVAVEEGFVIQKTLQNNYPEIKLKVVSAQLENYATIPIRDLSTGLVDAYIGNLLSTTYLIQSMGYTNVKVAAPTPFDNHNQAMAIRDDWPELVSIINKTLSAMTAEEHAEIRNRWLSVRYEYGISYTDVAKWILSLLAGASLVVGLVIFWNRRLKKEVVLREKIEADLLKSENRLRSALDATPFPVAFADLNADKILYWSRSALSLFGHTVPTTSEWFQVAYPDPDYRQDVIERWNPFLEIAKTSELPVNTGEYQITCKDGSVKTCELYATFITDFLIVTFSDITERKQAEEALRESEEMMRNSQSVAHISSYSTNLNENDIEKSSWVCSPEFYKIFGIDQTYPHTISGWAGFIHPDYREEIISYHESVVKEKISFNREYKIIRINDGEERWVHGTGKLEFDINGNPIRMHGAIQDITERKQAEMEQEKLKAQLNQAQKIESVGRLAGGVAHDFNNMLNVILGHTEMALEELDPATPLFTDLQAVQQAAERSANLTRQLLTFARKQTVAPKVIDLNETVEGMLKMLYRLIGEDIELAWLPMKNLAPVKVDPSQIDQILANLLVNSRDAIDDVGKITIETAAVAFDDAYCAEHTGFKPGEYILLAVSDDGCGMDRETLKHIFEPFFTSKKQDKGTGLGLASVYGAVKQNNGFVNVYSEPGQGTTFRIYLPKYTVKSASVSEKVPDRPAEHGHETILLVEDEPAILKMTTRMLERLGYTVVAATTPGEAIRLAHEYRERINLLMTDVVMPEMNGRELAGNLLSHYPGLKRLFMSGYTANVIAHHGVLDQGVHFIQKPFSKKDLAGKLREALED